MANEKKHGRIQVDAGGIIGPIWFIGWLFTLAYVQLPWWKAIIGLIIWPYFLGTSLR
ncbi:MAG: hypothetical protein ACETWG_12485 [Candidatus Neomarinimicrobiota bacterium]